MTQNWQDLRARTLSSVAMVVVGLAAILAGGVWFQMLAVFATAVMIWELWNMIAPDRPTVGMLLAAGVAALLSGIFVADRVLIAAMFLIPPVLGAVALRKERITFFVFALLILLSGWALVEFRNQLGLHWLLWLLGVVVLTDVAGYFAGRTFGGPKFWGGFSPKKTWSGTSAGWVCAAIFGAAVAVWLNKPIFDLVLVSILVSFASQMGDIGESALKRRMNVKDSSTLIPGHGGLFDRFDGVLGATLAMLLASQFTALPEIAL
ncbi:MAG: phosphatidate cytidylyltransferase [Pseudomonadota bacterium]